MITIELKEFRRQTSRVYMCQNQVGTYSNRIHNTWSRKIAFVQV